MKHCFYVLFTGLTLGAIGAYAQTSAPTNVVTMPNSITPGNNNVFMGHTSINPQATGFFNVGIGYYAGRTLTSGIGNVFIGFATGYNTTSGISNVFIGNNSGSENTTANYNTFLGGRTGYRTTTGEGNSFIGYQAGYENISGEGNTFMGYQAGLKSTSSYNTFLGYKAGQNVQSGGNNVFIGYQSGINTTTGIANLFLGSNSGVNNVSGDYNLFMGNAAGQSNSSGTGNTAIGDGSFLNSSSGGGNTAIGRYAGINLTTGSNNTFIGTAATVPQGNGSITNSTAIGYNALVTASNSIVLGSGAENVGIGNSAPSTKLHITTGVANTSGLRLENLTSSSPANGGQSKFLTVDASGNIILGTSGAGGRMSAEETLWQRTPTGAIQSVQNNPVVIGQGVSATPAGYKLFVEQGILTEQVKVAVKHTSDWSDYVFTAGYKLATLAQVEAHINRTGHLPGVPSAQQMVEQGNDLHKTDAKLLEKIEELTLYSIQLEKTNQQLRQNDQKQQAEIDELKQAVKQLTDKK